jgi:hypothetical protein
VIFSLGAIALLFACAKTLYGPVTALWACALMAAAAPQVTYAQEARCYAMVTFLCLATLWATLRLVNDGFSWRRAALVTFCVTATMLTHYFAIGAVLAVFVFAMHGTSGRRRGHVLGAFVTAAALYAIVWGPFLLKQRSNFHRDTMAFQDSRATHVQDALIEAGAAPLRQLSGSPVTSGVLASIVAVAVIASIFLSRRRRELLLAHLWILLSLGVLLMLDLATSTTVVSLLRYTTLAAPGVFMLLCAAPSAHRQLRHLVPLAALIYSAATLSGAYRTWKGDWKSLGDYLQHHARAGEPVVLSRFGQGWTAGGKYLALSFYDAAWSQPIVVTDRKPLTGSSLDQLRQYPVMWIVTDGSDIPPEAVVPGVESAQGISAPGAAAIWRATWRESSTQPASG